MTELTLPFDDDVTPLDRAYTIIVQAPDQFRDGFYVWLKENWDLYRNFEREGLRVLDRGREHYSAHRIIEYMRHDTMLRGVEDDFKINEAWTSSMARLFAHLNPRGANLFEFRVRKGGIVANFEPLETL